MSKHTDPYRYRSADFAVDQDYLSQHDLIFESPARHWESALALGNGNVGALHYLPESPVDIRWLVNKTDLWDLSAPTCLDRSCFAPHSKIVERLKRGERIRYGEMDGRVGSACGHNTRKSAGFVRIGPMGVQSFGQSENFMHFASENIQNATQRLQLRNGLAIAEIDIQHPYELHDPLHPKTVITSFVHATKNVLVIHILRPWAAPIELYRWLDDTTGTEPESFADGLDFGVAMQLTPAESVWPKPYPRLFEGVRYVMRARMDAPAYRTSAYPHRAGADFCLGESRNDGVGSPAKMPEELTLYVALATNFEHDDPDAEAKRLLDVCIAQGYEETLREHREWWRDFWGRSMISIPHKPIENLWYFGLYQLASCSRAEPHVGIAGLWYGPDGLPGHHDTIAWQGSWTNDQNTTSPSFWVLPTNHPELLRSYMASFSKLMPTAEATTQAIFGMRGMHFPLATTPNGMDLVPYFGRYNLVSGPLVASLYWMAADYLQDDKLIAEQVYPFLRSASLFFIDLMSEKDEGGRYFLWPCFPSEQSRHPSGVERNPTGTLMMIKILLRKTREFATRLSVDEKLCEEIDDLLAFFPQYPNNGTVFLQSEDERDPRFHRHLSRTEVGFPNAEITIDDPGPELEMLKRTVETLRRDEFWATGAKCGWEIFYQGGSLARLGLGNELLQFILGHAIPCHLKPNGFLGCYPLHPPDRQHRQEVSQTLIEGNGGLGNCITEMLLQSWRGIIRVFPAWPDAWEYKEAVFADLRAEGAFLVSSRRSRDGVLWVGIYSERGGVCKLINPWPGADVQVIRLPSGEPVAYRSEGGLIVFDTEERNNFRIFVPGAMGRYQRDGIVLTATEATVPRIIECLDGSQAWLGKLDIYRWMGNRW